MAGKHLIESGGAHICARAWNVRHCGRLIDTVWFDADCDKEYVLRALIEHDGYPFDISVSVDRTYEVR